MNASGNIEELDMPVTTLISSVMSLSSHRPAEVASFKLEAGAALYCFSDGAYEFTLASGQGFGVRRLLRSISSTHKMVWPEGLLGNLRAENKKQFFPDDLTILRITLT
jgi:serine phosphatase RsbU (regulator of sigma subunit)